MVTVLAHGVFDVLHPGHLEHLRQARAMGDRLVVSVTAARHVRKGPGRPAFGDAERLEMLRALRVVDDVFLCDDPSAVPAIRAVKPAIYVKGPDYADRNRRNGKLTVEREAVEAAGGVLAFTQGGTMSSTALLRATRQPPIPQTAAEVLAWLDRCAGLAATVIGERITDKYIFVEPVGKSPKEELVTYRGDGSSSWPGGADAVAGHLKALGADPAVLSVNAALTKMRFVSKPFNRKTFSFVPEPHEVPPLYVPPAFATDLVVVADFGHGLIRGKERARQIRQRAKFLALTAQSNSLNWGFNLLAKWERADYFVVDEPELRLTRSDRWGDVRDLLDDELRRLGAKMAAVTLGHYGCLACDGREFAEIPALSDRVVDRMGAGDAFLGWSAPLAFLGAPLGVVAFVGSVAAGIKVGKLGNEPVTRQEVVTWVRATLN